MDKDLAQLIACDVLFLYPFLICDGRRSVIGSLSYLCGDRRPSGVDIYRLSRVILISKDLAQMSAYDFVFLFLFCFAMAAAGQLLLPCWVAYVGTDSHLKLIPAFCFLLFALFYFVTNIICYF